MSSSLLPLGAVPLFRAHSDLPLPSLSKGSLIVTESASVLMKCKAVIHISEVSPGGIVRHRVVNSSRSLARQRMLAKFASRFTPLCLATAPVRTFDAY